MGEYQVMDNEKVTLDVLNPRGKLAEFSEFPSSPRLSSLSGRKIGILNNTKNGAETLIPYLKEALQRRYPDIELGMWKVNYALSKDVKEPKLKEIAEYCNGVIALLGD